MGYEIFGYLKIALQVAKKIPVSYFDKVVNFKRTSVRKGFSYMFFDNIERLVQFPPITLLHFYESATVFS